MPALHRRVLDPLDRSSEVLFGLIMVLTFTGSLSVAEAERSDVREMLIGALGCNLAWGLIDGVFYLMNTVVERGRSLQLHRRILAEPAAAGGILAGALPSVAAQALGARGLEDLQRSIAALPEPQAQVRFERDDLLGALGVMLLVFFSTLPVVVPFVLMHDAWTALRVSNAIAIAMLFLCGLTMGRLAGGNGWRAGLSMVLVGVVLVAITIALGG